MSKLEKLFFLSKLEKILYVTRLEMQFCVTCVILRDLAALVPQIFYSPHKITHFLTGYINSYYTPIFLFQMSSSFDKGRF
jgi:hypothetical protein